MSKLFILINLIFYTSIITISVSSLNQECVFFDKHINEYKPTLPVTLLHTGGTCNGLWLTYSEEYFQGSGKLWFRRLSYGKFFIKLDGVKSIKYVGSLKNFEESSITFYEGTEFTGNEEYYQTSTASLTIAAPKSLIITGNQPWSIQIGKKVECLRPTNDTHLAINNLMKFGMNPRFIGAIDKGCYCA